MAALSSPMAHCMLGLVLLLSATSVLSVRRVIYRALPEERPQPVFVLRQAPSTRVDSSDSDSSNFMNALTLAKPVTLKEGQTKWNFFGHDDDAISLKPPPKETIIHHHYIPYPPNTNNVPSPFSSYPPYVAIYPHIHHHRPHYHPYPYPPPPPHHHHHHHHPYGSMYGAQPGQPNPWSPWYGGVDNIHEGQNGFSYPEDDDVVKSLGRRPKSMEAEDESDAPNTLPSADPETSQ